MKTFLLRRKARLGTSVATACLAGTLFGVIPGLSQADDYYRRDSSYDRPPPQADRHDDHERHDAHERRVVREDHRDARYRQQEENSARYRHAQGDDYYRYRHDYDSHPGVWDRPAAVYAPPQSPGINLFLPFDLH